MASVESRPRGNGAENLRLADKGKKTAATIVPTGSAGRENRSAKMRPKPKRWAGTIKRRSKKAFRQEKLSGKRTRQNKHVLANMLLAYMAKSPGEHVAYSTIGQLTTSRP
jgi:hypothetical protein